VLVEAVEAASAELGEAGLEGVGERGGRGFGRFGCGFAAADGLGLGGGLGNGRGADGKEGVEAGAFAESHDAVGYLVYGVAGDQAVADDAVDGAAAGVEQAHVVVDFGGCGDGGTGIAGGVFLLDGDGGGEAIDEVDVGLLDALKELAGVGGEGLDVAALALGVDGVEGERAFSRAGDSRDHGDLSVGDIAADVLQVVGPRAADSDLIVQNESTRPVEEVGVSL